MIPCRLLMLGLSAATFLALPASAAQYWGQFNTGGNCDGDDVGDAFDIGDSGCLDRLGDSIKFHSDSGGSAINYAFVVSPDGECPCQDQCQVVQSDDLDGECWQLVDDKDGASYRFVFLQGPEAPACPANNC